MDANIVLWLVLAFATGASLLLIDHANQKAHDTYEQCLATCSREIVELKSKVEAMEDVLSQYQGIDPEEIADFERRWQMGVENIMAYGPLEAKKEVI